jgi:hypothetical protein
MVEQQTALAAQLSNSTRHLPPISQRSMKLQISKRLVPAWLRAPGEVVPDGVLWHVAELIEDCQNGGTANVTFL